MGIHVSVVRVPLDLRLVINSRVLITASFFCLTKSKRLSFLRRSLRRRRPLLLGGGRRDYKCS
ncbi:Uncharacterized protein APZ42_030694 [Daphnia magna]|uniref:Uncharacterized protein n=1 Tax=Daphnia magna TaxID=35525 RepID=A0A164NHE6_9CRUS|nr:Uncharacterized protein APZ42_030694 [Daphnia magna]